MMDNLEIWELFLIMFVVIAGWETGKFIHRKWRHD